MIFESRTTGYMMTVIIIILSIDVLCVVFRDIRFKKIMICVNGVF
jgi:hypothetical protein